MVGVRLKKIDRVGPAHLTKDMSRKPGFLQIVIVYMPLLIE